MLNHIKTIPYMGGYQSYYEHPDIIGTAWCCHKAPVVNKVYDDVPGYRERYYTMKCSSCGRTATGSTTFKVRDSWNNLVLGDS